MFYAANEEMYSSINRIADDDVGETSEITVLLHLVLSHPKLA